jgi:hypothetical protein
MPALRIGEDVTQAVANAATPIAPNVQGLMRGSALLISNPVTPFAGLIKSR